MVTICIIPARFGSTRLPGKPLITLGNKPIIQWVYERALESKCFEHIFVATDDERILEAVQEFRGQAIMTSKEAPSGTDRVHEAIENLLKEGYKIDESSVIVNIQGDEPFIKSEMIKELVELMKEGYDYMGTLATAIKKEEDFLNPNIVKVVFDYSMNALYFSRSPIPFNREKYIKGSSNNNFMYKHIGIYGYSFKVLKKFVKLPQSNLERIESLEQLRAIENGIRIKIAITEYDSFGIDTPEDLEVARKCLNTFL